jgi:hypothetical protein
VASRTRGQDDGRAGAMQLLGQAQVTDELGEEPSSLAPRAPLCRSVSGSRGLRVA